MRLLHLLILIFLFEPVAIAQTSDEGDANVELEALYDQFDKEEDSKAKVEQEEKIKQRATLTKEEEGTLAELKILSPFEDIAVIQRRFMPKTKRFELSAALGNSLNNAFFNNWGFIGRAGFYLTEKHGLEFQFFWLNSNERDVTESLRNDQNVQTTSLVVPENYKGLSYKYVPVYGKIALFNTRIIPFDLYFAAGGGMTKTGLNQEETTIHLGTGQQFYLTKALSFRWDFALNMYQADYTYKETDSGPDINATKAQTDLFISLGMSWYWPGAKYR